MLREKVLLVAFAALGAAIWGANFISRTRTVYQSYSQVKVEFDQQQMWLRSREQIERASVEAIRHLDPAKTLNPSDLISALSGLASAHGLAFISDVPQTEQSGVFSVNSVTITVRTAGKEGDAEFTELQNFCADIAAKSPYMGIQQLSVVASRSNAKQLSAVLKVISVQVAR